MSRVAFITGASSGLGAEMARQLVAQGHRVGVFARREQRLAALADELGEAVFVTVGDVTNAAAVQSAVHATVAALGPIDLAIANAGVSLGAPIETERTEDFERMLAVNVMGAYHTVKAVLPGMIARKQGQIVGISSLASYRGLPGSAGYCATKAAMSRWLEGIRLELHGHNIAVTTIQPGFVKSEMTDQNEFKMPFFMETAPAVKRMLRAIERRKKTYDFPKRTSLSMRLLRCLPDWLVRRLSPKGSLAKSKRS